jgi:(p)ppGpp synthase/HD superfamily hydrolase
MHLRLVGSTSNAATQPALARLAVRYAQWKLAREKIRVLATRLAASETATRMRITLEVGDLGQLRRILLHLQDMPGVARVGRC